MKVHIPGKLRARPVQHPATPALITIEEEKTKGYNKGES